MGKLDGWGRDISPFHQGEQEIHNRFGIKERQEQIGKKIIRPFMPDEHREFYAQLPFFIIGSVDEEGWPWASALFGKPGFIKTPDDKTLTISGKPSSIDPLAQNIQSGSQVSFLGIEPPTRRRNRINATISDVNDTGFKAHVDQSFGNCPQYINARDIEWMRQPDEPAPDQTGKHFTSLDDDMLKTIIKKADTFFVSSYIKPESDHTIEGVDINHRGGLPGFVKIEGNTLTIPDYRGNFAFNTLGNFLLNPMAGLLFIDFETGDIVHMTGTTEILWDDHPSINELPGALRAWKFHLKEGILIKQASPIRWHFQAYSPSMKHLEKS